MKKSSSSELTLISMVLLVVIRLTFAQENAVNPNSADQAVVILSSNTLPEMQRARRILESQGCRIRNIFPPSVLIAHVPRLLKPSLEKSDSIQMISYDVVTATNYISTSQDAIMVWNRRLQIQKELAPVEAGIVNMSGVRNTAWDSMVTNENIDNSKDNPIGRAYGADSKDTSLYMAGDIAVAIIFMIPPKADSLYTGEWLPGEKEASYAVICNALDQYIDDEPNARLAYTFVKEDIDGFVAGDDNYVNYLRNTYNTHWAYLIYDFKRLRGASININHPCVYVSAYTPDLWPWLWFSVRHESLHLFGAADQYLEDNPSTSTIVSGYLKVVNANSVSGSEGYFDGLGEGKPDIMALNTKPLNAPLGVYTRGEIGWRDEDGDGILDPLDTYPKTYNLIRSGNNPFLYTGIAVDQPFLNGKTYSFSFGGVTLNTITSVEYRLNNSTWCTAQPEDGVFDSAEEKFFIALPTLKNGSYLLEVRAANSVGNVEHNYAKDWITVTDSPITDVQPLAAFTVWPPKGSVNKTKFIFTNQSSDFEDNPLNLKATWQFETKGNGFQFAPNEAVSFTYTTPGTKMITLQVKDSSGQIHWANKQVEVGEYDLPPVAAFVASPESQHGTGNGSFKVTLNAQGSYDAEDDFSKLRLNWDIDEDGQWESQYSNQVHFIHNYPLPSDGKSEHHRIRLEVVDSIGNASQATRDVWVVPYNHPPTLKGIEFESAVIDDKLCKYIEQVNPLQSRFNPNLYFPEPYLGYLHISGHYAYLLSRVYGLHIVDITSPSNPVVIGSLELKGGGVSHFCFSGNYAYISVIGYPSGLAIVDILNPHTPTLINFLPLGLISNKMIIQGNYLYAHINKSLKIIDISMPTAPIVMGVINIPNIDYRYYLYFSGSAKWLYIAYDNEASFSAKLLVFNIETPSAPILAAMMDLPSESPEQRIMELHIVGNYIYVGYYDTGLRKSGLYIIEFPAAGIPVYLGKCDFDGIIENMFYTDDYAYVICNELEAGKVVRTIKISNPNSPTIGSNFKCDSLNFSDFCVVDNYVLCLERTRGLIIYKPGILRYHLTAVALAQDPDVNSDPPWHGPLEYRWDFDKDGVWDTFFSTDNSALIPDTYFGLEIACQVRDRFGATRTTSAVVPKDIQEK